METDEVVKQEPASQPAGTSTSSTTATSAATPSTPTVEKAPPSSKLKLPSITLPEVDLYLHLLVLVFAIDRQKYKQVLLNQLA